MTDSQKVKNAINEKYNELLSKISIDELTSSTNDIKKLEAVQHNLEMLTYLAEVMDFEDSSYSSCVHLLANAVKYREYIKGGVYVDENEKNHVQKYFPNEF